MINYRPEIDGLRALAVLPVVLFHAGFSWLSGGYVGVDVFFVISGYLITSTIISDLDKRNFSLAKFYERRVRRIFPALFFYLLLSSLLVFLYFPPHAVKDYAQSLFATSLFVSNIFFYFETDYFNNLSEMSPLLHTWSLAVEEQFYIIFPIILWSFYWLNRKILIITISLLTLFSLIWSEYLLLTDPTLAYYGPGSRFWELSIGGLMACFLHYWDFKVDEKISHLLSSVGLVFIVVSIISFSPETNFPGFNATLPVFGSLLVIAFSSPYNLVGKILSNGNFVSIGLISYSLYLSHHIVFATLRNVGFGLDTILFKITAIIISLILACFSYRYVEQPLRRAKLGRRSVFGLAAMCIIVFATMGMYGHKSDGLKAYKLNSTNEEYRSRVIDAHAELNARKKVWEKILINSNKNFSEEGSGQKILILGDSKSEDLYVASKLADQDNMLQIRRLRLDDLCMEQDFIYSSGGCQKELQEVFESAVYLSSEVVVLSATWQYLSNENVVRFVERLIQDQKSVVVVSTANFNDVSSLSYVIARRNMEEKEIEKYLFQNIRQDWRKQFLSLKTKLLNKNYDINFLEKLEVFCDLPSEKCSLQENESWYIYDSGHLTISGAYKTGSFFNDYINELN